MMTIQTGLLTPRAREWSVIAASTSEYRVNATAMTAPIMMNLTIAFMLPGETPGVVVGVLSIRR